MKKVSRSITPTPRGVGRQWFEWLQWLGDSLDVQFGRHRRITGPAWAVLLALVLWWWLKGVALASFL
jgi:hypothetical protein